MPRNAAKSIIQTSRFFRVFFQGPNIQRGRIERDMARATLEGL